MAQGARSSGKSAASGAKVKPKRQAVVIVHGQGEQRPMGTLRDFIEVLWTRNPDVTPQRPETYIDDEGDRAFWVVPDRKAGLYELQRVTTPADSNGRRTDFFELYYADLLNNTPFKNLWRWMRRLLWIDPADLPHQVRWPWSLFLLMTVAAAMLAVGVVLSISELVHTNWLAELVRPETRVWFYGIAGAAAALLLPKLTSALRFLERIPGWVIGTVVVVSVAAIFRDEPVALYLDALLVLIYFAVRYLLPYFGDAASYLSAQTETVQSRQDVRKRGLSLFRALHDDDSYDRVVVVAHSLGTVLAYDLVHILWGEVGPTKDNPPEDEAVAALQAVDDFAAARLEVEWSEEDVAAYQELQWAAFSALRKQKGDPAAAPRRINGWKISDFVALGSPLASAQFLIAEGADDFTLMKEQRVLPTAPPQAYDRRMQALYDNREVGCRVSHHGAAFSAVRWHNIYDPFHPVLFFLGDPIAGPVSGRERFGPGVADIPVTIKHGGPVPRLFTHNHYWTETSDDWREPAAHITTLRDAVNLSRS